MADQVCVEAGNFIMGAYAAGCLVFGAFLWWLKGRMQYTDRVHFEAIYVRQVLLQRGLPRGLVETLPIRPALRTERGGHVMREQDELDAIAEQLYQRFRRPDPPPMPARPARTTTAGQRPRNRRRKVAPQEQPQHTPGRKVRFGDE